MGDDDLSGQRRKREARLLTRAVPDIPGVTVADVVAGVLVASNEGHSALDVPSYLAERGHTSTTMELLPRPGGPLTAVGTGDAGIVVVAGRCDHDPCTGG
jgi:hypothetical protein